MSVLIRINLTQLYHIHRHFGNSDYGKTSLSRPVKRNPSQHPSPPTIPLEPYHSCQPPLVPQGQSLGHPGLGTIVTTTVAFEDVPEYQAQQSTSPRRVAFTFPAS